MRTGTTAAGWRMLLNSLPVILSIAMILTILNPPLVLPAQAPMNIRMLSTIHVSGIHFMKSADVKPVLVEMETT